jgi:hypothetical protein
MSADQTTPPKPKLRWYQYRLRTLFVVMFLTAAACSWLAVKMEHARKQKEAVEGLSRLNAHVTYDYEEGLRTVPPGADREKNGPKSLRRIIGDDFFNSVTRVYLTVPSRTISDEDMELFASLRGLRELVITGPEIEITANQLKSLEHLSQLEILNLFGNKITDAGLEYLKGLNQLEILDLSGDNISDAGLEYLKGLNRLKSLGLAETRLTDNGLKCLEAMKQLQKLDIRGTAITSSGVDKLKKALPNLSTIYRTSADSR